MPSNAQLISSLVYSLLIVNSVFGAPAEVQRQRRQAFDFSSHGDGTDINVDGESTTTSWQDSHFDFNRDNSNWDSADRAPIVEDDGVGADIYDELGFTNENNGSDTAPVYPDYYGDEYSTFPGYDDGGINDGQQMCEQDCLITCLVSGTCDKPHCANYSCDSDPDNVGSDPCKDLCSYQCIFVGECEVPQCANYFCPDDYDQYYDSTPRTKEINDTEGGIGNIPKGDTTPKSGNETTKLCKDRDAIMRCDHGVCVDGVWCKCDEGWTGVICSMPCTLKCDRGNCMLKPSSELKKQTDEITEEDMFCNCEFDYRSSECKEKIPDKVAIAEEKARKLAIILGVCLTVAIATSIILPIILWRKRVIFVMRVVYYFKMWEDNDGKIYDAYISAGTTSRALKFVRNVLAPKLEQQGFKLFIPSRDQLCGAVISEDIITAIKQSRRTIMVVTPEYLQNDWSGFEVLNAQVEMIKLQQRIIPVILEDISEENPRIRKSLKHIMDSVKCLKVPGYKSTSSELQLMSTPKSKKKICKFWRRLELTMPKKREPVSSYRSNCYVQKDSSEQQSMLDENYSRSIPGSTKVSTNGDQEYNCIDVNCGDFHPKSYDAMAASKINPLSVYQISSNDQDIDISKYEQCFNLKTAL